MFGWKRYTGDAQGITIVGDSDSPPTRWWNHLFLLLWGWKVMVLLETRDQSVRDLYVGYRLASGEARVRMKPVRSNWVAVRVGHENCVFFLIDAKGEEIPISSIPKRFISV